MTKPQVLEIRLPQLADFLNEDFLLVSGKSMLAFSSHRYFFISNSDGGHQGGSGIKKAAYPSYPWKFSPFLKNTQSPDRGDASQR
jgi:hypothetical protein